MTERGGWREKESRAAIQTMPSRQAEDRQLRDTEAGKMMVVWEEGSSQISDGGSTRLSGFANLGVS